MAEAVARGDAYAAEEAMARIVREVRGALDGGAGAGAERVSGRRPAAAAGRRAAVVRRPDGR